MASTTFTSNPPPSSSDHHLHHHLPSSSSHRPSPPVPARSTLRPKTSASTITTSTSNLAVEHRPRPLDMQSTKTTTTTLERPQTSPSPLQSYFERYPTRNGKGKEKTANDPAAEGPGGSGASADRNKSLASKSSIDGMASARAKAARERAKALNSRLNAAHSDQDGPSAAAPSSSKTPSPAGGAVAFPTVDDPSSHDDADEDDDHARVGAESTTSSSAAATAAARRLRQMSEASSSSNAVPVVSAGVHRGHHREKSSGGHYRPPITTNNSGATAAHSNRPPREQLPRSQAYHHLHNFGSNSAGQSSSGRAGHAPTPDLLPFIRTSTSSTYTQTTLADQDPEFTTPLSTPKSSLYRADGVLVAGFSSGVGVETMDALVQGMNGGTDTTDDTDYLSSMFGRRPTSKKEKRSGSSLASTGLLGSSGTKLKYHPLYHPPLPQPPDGISLGTPKMKSRREGSTTEEDRSAPSNPASASVSSSEREKERERRPRKVSTGPSTTSSSHHRPATARSDITIKHGSRSASGPFDEVEVPTRKAYSRPSTRDRDRPRSSRHRDRDRVRGSRDFHHHHHHHHRKHEANSSSSSPRSEPQDLPVDLASPQPTPVLEKPPEPKAPVVVPSISDIIRTHAPAYSARPKRTIGAPPSSFTGFAGGAPSVASTSRRGSLVEEEDEVAGRSSIDSITAEVQESLRKSSGRFTNASGRMEQQSRESSDDYDETGSRRVSLTSPTFAPPKRPFPVVTRKTLQHAKSFGDRPRSVVVVSETPVFSSANSYRSPRSEGGAHSVIGVGHPGPPRPASRSASLYSGPTSSLAPSTPLSLGTPGITFTGGNTATQDPTKLELAQFLRSPRLTRLMTLRRHPHNGLTVSLADVGSPTGHPVIVYLGLGCVRYLIALYDEMAEALGLRLVCVDRWGLGRTGEPTTENGRGLLEWAAVIEEVADTLGLDMYSVIAHSAGAPYALAGVLKCGDRRLKGSVHLLAPWVSMSVDTGYKWLKYVPNGLIKTAQAAEWKVQGWMLGKPPTITYQGIEYDAAVAAAAEREQQHQENSLHRTLSPPNDVRSSLSTSSYDDLGDFDGKYESSSTLGRRAGALNQPGSSGKSSKKKPVKSILSIFNNNNAGSAASSVHTGSSKNNSARSSRANSLAGGASVKTLPGAVPKRSPKLKGLKSLSSLRTEGSTLEVTRYTSDPTLPNGLQHQQPPSLRSDQSQQDVIFSSAPPNINVGLGIGTDDEMMEWGARLQMLEEISPPTPPGSTSGRKASGATTTSASTDAPRGRRSVSLTGGRPAFLKDIVPPVPPLPTSPCLSVEQPHSPNTSINSSTGTSSTAVAPRKAPMSLANALLRASHAESLKGGTADLMAILERDSKPWGFSYADVRHPVKVWYGDRDEKIAISSVRWMERVMKDCTVTIVKGANHNLMTNADVVVEVLESIAMEWSEDPPLSPVGFRPPLVSASTTSLPRKKGRY